MEKRMTQEEMGERLNLSTSAYCKLEYGETDLTLTRLNQISEALGITPIDLFQKLGGSNYFTSCNHIGIGMSQEYNTINMGNSLEDLKDLIRANSRLIEMLCKRMDDLENRNKQFIK